MPRSSADRGVGVSWMARLDFIYDGPMSLRRFHLRKHDAVALLSGGVGILASLGLTLAQYNQLTILHWVGGVLFFACSMIVSYVSLSQGNISQNKKERNLRRKMAASLIED